MQKDTCIYVEWICFTNDMDYFPVGDEMESIDKSLDSEDISSIHFIY
jgi:hypothetical protein